MDTLFTVIVGALGLVAGVVVNMLADDLPFEKPLSPPRYADGTHGPGGDIEEIAPVYFRMFRCGHVCFSLLLPRRPPGSEA